MTTLHFTNDEEALRSEVRRWIATNDPGPPPDDYAARLTAQIEWQRRLAAAGFVGVSWPAVYGGRDMTLAAEAVVAEELAASSMPQLVNRLAVYTWGPTLLDYGTEDQKRRFLPGMLDASEIWCQGFSEPGAGSDLAGVTTRAVRDGDDFVVNGQKVWTTRAEISKWNGLLVRTDREARHRGLTILIVDMESAGVSIRPLPQMLDEPHFSEVFFDDVRVPVTNALGGLDEGWGVAMAAMSYERGLFVLERSIGLRRRLDDLVARLDRDGRIEDHLADVGRIHASLEVLQSQVYRTLANQAAGTLSPGASSVDKLFLAEVYQDLFATAYDLVGEDAGFHDEDEWVHDLLESRSVSIYSGTDQIQRSVIARQLLGLR